jgi:Uma2 family endonuclease
MNWQEIIENPLLQNLPFKVELNQYGNITMTPASNRHGIIQIKIGYLLVEKTKYGQVISECSVSTSKGVKVADLAWGSEEFMERNKDETPYKEAPDICVEIRSPSNTDDEMLEKIDLYLAKGAKEVWISDESGTITFYSYPGIIKKSKIIPDFPGKIH